MLRVPGMPRMLDREMIVLSGSEKAAGVLLALSTDVPAIRQHR